MMRQMNVSDDIQSAQKSEPLILLIEDSVILQTIVKSVIHQVNTSAKIQVISSAEEACQAIETGQIRESSGFDLIISELFLESPTTGTDFWKICKEHLPDTPFLFLADKPIEGIFRLIGRPNDVPASVKKPINMQDCAKLVRSFLAQDFQATVSVGEGAEHVAVEKEGSYTTVLVVETDVRTKEKVAFEFENQGYRAYTAESVEEAKEILAKIEVDTIVSIDQLPDGTGYDVYREYRKLHSLRGTTKIHPVLLSDAPSAVIPEDLDIDHCIMFEKPVDPKKVVNETVLELLRSGHPLRRTSERFEVSGYKVRMITRRFEPIGEGEILNLSQNGFFVGTFGDPNSTPGTELMFRMESLDPKVSAETGPIIGTASIRWVRNRPGSETMPQGYGIQILSLDPRSQGSLTKILNDLRSELQTC